MSFLASYLIASVVLSVGLGCILGRTQNDFGPPGMVALVYVCSLCMQHCVCNIASVVFHTSHAGLPFPKQTRLCFSSEDDEVVEACLAMEGSWGCAGGRLWPVGMQHLSCPGEGWGPGLCLGSWCLRGHREMQLLVLRNPTVGDRGDKCLEGGEGCRAHASLNTQNHLSARAFSAVEIF